MLHVTEFRLLGGTRLWARFDDGRAGEIDLRDELDGPVFGPLRDAQLFAAATLDPLTRTIVWPNGADFAPEFLASLIEATAAR